VAPLTTPGVPRPTDFTEKARTAIARLTGSGDGGGSGAPRLPGNDVAAGLIPHDRALLGRMVQDIAFFNARAYLGLELGSLGRGVEPAAA